MKDYKSVFECSIGDRKVVATAIGGGAWQNVFVGRLSASKSQDGMAVMASGGEYDGGGQYQVDHRANNHRSADAAELWPSLTACVENSMAQLAAH